MNNRRKLVIALGAGSLAAPFTSFAQQHQPKTFRIGFLGLGSASNTATRVEALRAGLRDFNYEEGKNLIIDFRWAEGKYDRLPELAAELVRLRVDFVVTHGGPGVRAASHATTTIPIVMAAGPDLVTEGIAASFARPGGNVTGGTFFNTELSAKRVELLNDAMPRVTQVAVLLHNQNDPAAKAVLQMMEATAKLRKVALQQFAVQGPDEFNSAFAAMIKKRVGAVVVPEVVALNVNPKAIADLAARYRLPSVGNKEFAESGGLIGYGVNIPEMFRRAAYFIDKILKGTRPAELPMEQATKFDLVVNLKAAKALGVKLPDLVLQRADQVIE